MLKMIPIGSSTSDVVTMTRQHSLELLSVEEWRALSGDKPSSWASEKRVITNSFGTFRRHLVNEKELSRYNLESQRFFSGTVNYVAQATFSSAYVVSLTFINGKYVGGDWGFLPG
jgi:hypothetical protein